MDQESNFSAKSYLRLLASFFGFAVAVAGTAGWTAYQVAGELAGSVWARSFIVTSEAGFVLDHGVYALATLPLAVALLILILGVVTLVVSLVFAIVGLTRLQKRLHRDYARISKSSRTINKEKIEFITEEYQDTIYSTIIDYDNLVKDIGHLKRLLSNSTSVYHNQESALAIRSKKTVLEIEADFDGRSTEFYTIEAVGGPVHFWTYFVSTDAEADPVRTPAGVAFDARFTSGNGSMIVIPTLNRLREKEFALFFDPPIERGGRRTIMIEYGWPGYWRQLAKKGYVDYFTRATHVFKDTAQLEVTFNFHGKSRDVVARDLSADGAGTLAFQEHATFRTWHYVHSAWRVDGTEYRIKFYRSPGLVEEESENN